MATRIKQDSAEDPRDDMPEDRKNTAADDVVINRSALKGHVEAIERLQEQVSEIREEMKDRMMLVKSEGWDPKAFRALLKVRAMDPEERREREAILDLYKHALGLD